MQRGFGGGGESALGRLCGIYELAIYWMGKPHMVRLSAFLCLVLFCSTRSSGKEELAHALKPVILAFFLFSRCCIDALTNLITNTDIVITKDSSSQSVRIRR